MADDNRLYEDIGAIKATMENIEGHLKTQNGSIAKIGSLCYKNKERLDIFRGALVILGLFVSLFGGVIITMFI